MATQSAVAGDMRVLRLLDADPDLGAGLDQANFDEARTRAVASAFRLTRGDWEPRLPDGTRDSELLGVLVVSGLLMRCEAVGARPGAELIGAGDFLRPWVLSEGSCVDCRTSWSVVEPTVLAYLDRGFAMRVAEWPELMVALIERTASRARLLTFQIALTQLRRIDQRILVLLWRLAERWGKVHPEGVVVPLRLTHEALSRLIGAQRPTVTTAIKQLVTDGTLERRPNGGWLLRGDPLKGRRPLNLAGTAANGSEPEAASLSHAALTDGQPA